MFAYVFATVTIFAVYIAALAYGSNDDVRAMRAFVWLWIIGNIVFIGVTYLQTGRV